MPTFEVRIGDKWCSVKASNARVAINQALYRGHLFIRRTPGPRGGVVDDILPFGKTLTITCRRIA